MAITGNIFKSLIFDGQASRNYGVYITGQAVYNAPERAVEMIAIPGRDGAFALDQGRFENIEVTYPAGIFADNERDFAQAVSDFRNYLCSRKGYCRLSDEYNPDEYRMGVYKSGLEVTPAQLKAGEFTITFDCKPQRFLTSGEVAVSVDDGDTLLNPTLFESKPLLEVEGYGTIGFNDYEIEIASVDIGDITLTKSKNGNVYTLGNLTDLNTGDTITVASLECRASAKYTGKSFHGYSSVTASGVTGATVTAKAMYETIDANLAFPSEFTLTYGTSATMTETIVIVARATTNMTATFTIGLAYDGDDTITMSASVSSSPSPSFTTFMHTLGNVTAYSSKPYNFGSIFCDCDLGEFYRLEDGVPISMNHVGDLGSDLPKLASGSNTITFDNTITDLKITPRWQKV